jgi:hypothetical protein
VLSGSKAATHPVNAAFARRVSRWIGINRLNRRAISAGRAMERHSTTTLVKGFPRLAHGFHETF